MAISRRVFINQMGMGALGLALAPTIAHAFHSRNLIGSSLPRSTPELQGMSSAGISSFLDAIEKSGIQFHSLMIVRNGSVVTEGWWAPYAAPLKHTLYSLSKSFTSSAVGLAIAEGKFTLDSPVVSFFPDDKPADVSANLAAMKVKHLLSMSTGHFKDTTAALREGPDSMTWAKKFLMQPVEREPGTYFVYNTGATYMLSAIVQKATGQNVLDYLKPRLFEPLGIEGMDWENNAEGVSVGGYGLRVRTEDIAKFGLLYLQKGKWNGKQILPAAWIDDATASHVDNSPGRTRGKQPDDDWAQGYGYQFWRCTHNAVRGDGAFGQFCIMMPEQNAVVAITSESFDLQGSMNLIWNHLLPAFSPNSQSKSSGATTELLNRLTKLTITLPQAAKTSPQAARISGRKFTLRTNEFNLQAVTFQFNTDHTLVTLSDDRGEQKVKCGINSWMIERDFKTQALFPLKNRPTVTTPLAASVTWVDDNTLVMTLRYTETAHGDQINFSFESNNVAIRFLHSVAKGNPTTVDARAVITGAIA
jgi:CubicO group peptidase (beta-lactamase class C family)